MKRTNVQVLGTQVDTLIEMYQRLVEENQRLRTDYANLLKERDTLLEKNTLARTRLEQMIARLKSIEMGTPHE